MRHKQDEEEQIESEEETCILRGAGNKENDCLLYLAGPLVSYTMNCRKKEIVPFTQPLQYQAHMSKED